MVLVAVEAVPVDNKPPAAVRVRIAMGERHGFGAAAPLSIRSSSLLQGWAGDPMSFSPKLARQIGSGLTSANNPSNDWGGGRGWNKFGRGRHEKSPNRGHI